MAGIVRRGTDETRRLASISAAADYADISTRTLRRYIAEGRITGYRVGPRLVKVDLADLDRIVRPIPTASAGAESDAHHE